MFHFSCRLKFKGLRVNTFALQWPPTQDLIFQVFCQQPIVVESSSYPVKISHVLKLTQTFTDKRRSHKKLRKCEGCQVFNSNPKSWFKSSGLGVLQSSVLINAQDVWQNDLESVELLKPFFNDVYFKVIASSPSPFLLIAGIFGRIIFLNQKRYIK